MMTTTEPPEEREQRILILAPTGRDGALTARFLVDAGLAAVVCDGVEDLCAEMGVGVGLILLAGEALTPGAMRRLAGALGQQPTWSDIPIVVLTSGGGGAPANEEALAALGEAGNVTLVERPVRVMTLLSAVKAALRARRRQYDLRDYLAAEGRAKDALERAILRAEEASRLKDEFLATVSHELRTPLTAVLGWANLLRSNNLDEAGRARAVEIIERNARSQQQLIEDLLDVSRIVTGQLRLDVRRVEVSSFIETAVEAVRPAAEAKGIRLEQISDEAVGPVSGDPARLQQVVWNLLTNAIKFTPRGGRVEVRCGRVNSHLEIVVSDTGDGIAPGFLPHVFDRFRQADMGTTRSHGGLGLGLAVVRHLVELHGGAVRAESEGEGRGSTFTVSLPLAPVYRTESLTQPEHTAVVKPRPIYDCPEKLDGLRVLVVDDEPDTLELLKAGLEHCGAQVLTAGTAGEALGMLRGGGFGLLISDIGMPGKDGYELIAEVRRLAAEEGGKVPAVALTAYARTEDRLRALRAGYQMHVTKPVEVAELVAVASALSRGDSLS